jgi:hypothetical protein
MENNTQMQTYEYGAVSSKYSLQAKNKLVAYYTMVAHYNRSAHLMVIYSPEECKEDTWVSFDGKISKRLDEIFGGDGSFDKFGEENIDEIRTCYKSIKQLV